MKAKITHLTSAHVSFDIRIFQKECRSLACAGYDVSLIAPHAGNDFVQGIHIEGVRKGGSRLLRMTRTANAVFWKALRLDAEMYHFHDPELIPAGLLLRALGKKVVYDVHEDVPRSILSKQYLRRWQRRPLALLLESLEDIAARCFSGLVTVTPTIRNRFQPYQRNTILVRNFPRLEEFPRARNGSWQDRLPAVAYVGEISTGRGIDEMVGAMGLLPSTLGARLLIATKEFPQGLVERLKRDPGWVNVENRGSLVHDEIAALLSTVRAGLVLFHPEPNHVAAMPHKLYEYMAAGIPVIASDFPLWRQMVVEQQCGIVVNPLDPRAVALAIEFILTHPLEAESMGRRGRAAIEQNYNWATEERSLLQFYDALMPKKA